MALTQDDWNKLSIVISEVIDNKLDEKFDPIIYKMNLLSAEVEELYTRLDTLFVKLFEKLEQLNRKAILYNLSKVEITEKN